MTPGFGAVTGAVVDIYGEGIPETKVILLNEKMGIRRDFLTSDDGVFGISGLIPAEGYALKLSRKGFANWETGDFVVSIGPALNFKITLRTEDPPKHVEASSVLPIVDDTKTGVGYLVTQGQIDSLPSAGRRWDAMTALAPLTGPADASQFTPRGRSSFPPVFIDGGEVTNNFFVETASPRRISQDAAQEIQVLSNGYSAPFRGAMGGLVDVATRSGGNEYHGAVYDYFRNHTLSATDRHAPGFNPPGHDHQGGLSLGGPIIRNKIFFFANFEAMDAHSEGLNRITNPAITDPTGSFVLPSNCKATALQCANAAKFIQSRMNVVVPRTAHSGVALAKIDYRRSNRHSFSLEASGTRWLSPNGVRTEAVSPDGALLGSNGNAREDSRYFRLAWTSTPHSTTVNEFHASWSKDDLVAAPSQGLLPSTGLLSISIAGSAVGAAEGFPRIFPDELRRELSDHFIKAFNTHTIQFGGGVSWLRDRISQIDSAGAYSYPSLTAFAQDLSGITVGRKAYTSYDQQFGNPYRDYHVTDLGSYVEDTWRAFPRLTFTYGARWEKQFIPAPPAYHPVYFQTSKVPSPNVDAAPRIGAAYTRNERTVYRASFGYFFAPYSGQALDALLTGNNQILNSISVSSYQTAAPIFPGAFPGLTSVPNGTSDVMYAVDRLRLPHSNQATLSMERHMNDDTTLTVNLVATRGIKLWSTTDLNLLTPTKIATYTVDDANGTPFEQFNMPIFTAKSDPNTAHVYVVGNGASSWYNALTVQLRRRMLRTLNINAVYTWSHAIDDAGNPAGFTGASTYPAYPRADMGSSATDQRHRGVVSWVWWPELAGKALPAIRSLLNGWEISGIATVATGTPTTPVIMVSGQQFSGTTMVYTNSLNGSGGWNRVTFDQVSSLRTKPMYNLDARLTRTLRFGERAKAELMFEAYDALNMQHDTAVNNIAYIATSGVLRPVSGLGAGNASYGLLDGTNARRCQVALRIVF